MYLIANLVVAAIQKRLKARNFAGRLKNRSAYLGLVYASRRADRYDTKGPTWIDLIEDYFILFIKDHGFLRVLYSNRLRLAGGLIRANQPGPLALYLYARTWGIRSVINLRGGDRHDAFYRLENFIARRLEIPIYTFRTFSRGLLGRDEVLRILSLLPGIPRPCLVHCKSGADRTGQFCIWYRHIVLGESVADAIEELSPKYGHFKITKTGILDFQFEHFLKDASRDVSLSVYYKRHYDEKKITELFRESRRGGALAKILEIILNRE